jgi:hypothetical protein
MYHRRCMMTAVSVAFLQLALTSLSVAQFKVTDNFNRPDGAVGLGWSTWGNGAQISGNQLETFGKDSVAGGIQRKLNVTFPLMFSFDFSTAAPSDGGWQVTFNASTANGGRLSNYTGEIGVYQFSGSREVCTKFQTSSGPVSQCVNLVNGQRDFTAVAHISGTVNCDFSMTIKAKYNDGLLPAVVTIKTPAPVGAIQTSQGQTLFFGNINETYGPDFFDNFSLTLE